MNLDRIFHEDCLLGMDRLTDGSVDLILVDPPFGTTNPRWDRRLPLEPMWQQFLRVTKHNAAIVIFAQMPFGAELILSQPKLFRYEWIWEKPMAAGHLNANKMPLRAHENILVFYRSLPTYNPQYWQSTPYVHRQSFIEDGVYGRRQNDQTYRNADGRRYPRDVIKCYNRLLDPDWLKDSHPTQKPVGLLEYLIRTYTDEGELVLDSCMGIGSTAIAAIRAGRHFIGFETEGTYVEIARRRIEAERRKEIGRRNMPDAWSTDENWSGEANIFAVEGI